MSRAMHVGGFGMVPFQEPHLTQPFDVTGERAAGRSFDVTDVGHELVQLASAGWVYGDSTFGRPARCGPGRTNIASVNSCSTRLFLLSCQVDDAKSTSADNIELDGAFVVTLYEKTAA